MSDCTQPRCEECGAELSLDEGYCEYSDGLTLCLCCDAQWDILRNKKPDTCEYCGEPRPCDCAAGNEPDPTSPEDAVSGDTYGSWLARRRHERRMDRPEE